MQKGSAGLVCHCKVAQKEQTSGQGHSANLGHSGGKDQGQPYLVHQQLEVGLDWYTDLVGAIDGLPVRTEGVGPSGGGALAAGPSGGSRASHSIARETEAQKMT